MEPRINLMTNAIGTKISKRIFAVSLAVKEAQLPPSIENLVSLRVSQINGCGWCVDIHTKDAAAAGESPERLNLVAAWRHAGVFSEAERAALAIAEEGTRVADDGAGVSDQTWSAAREHYSEDQLVGLVTLVAMMNATNRLGVIANLQGGSYRPGALDSLAG